MLSTPNLKEKMIDLILSFAEIGSSLRKLKVPQPLSRGECAIEVLGYPPLKPSREALPQKKQSFPLSVRWMGIIIGCSPANKVCRASTCKRSSKVTGVSKR